MQQLSFRDNFLEVLVTVSVARIENNLKMVQHSAILAMADQ